MIVALHTGSGDSSDWSSSDDDGGDPYANSPLKPSMLANKTAQWEWRSQQQHQSNLTSPKVIARYRIYICVCVHLSRCVHMSMYVFECGSVWL